MSARPAIYLDSNAGAPLQPRVAEALLPFLQSNLASSTLCAHSNASSTHAYGRSAKRWINQARTSIFKSIGIENPEESQSIGSLVLTSSGTEATQMAIRSALNQVRSSRSVHWISSSTEHECTLRMIQESKDTHGFDFLSVNSDGLPSAEELKALLKPHTALISLLWVNNETGVIFPVSELISKVRTHFSSHFPSEPQPWIHLDAAQAWGKIPIQALQLGADSLGFSGHKIGALSGSGALWASPGSTLIPVHPGMQQSGLRGGTENLLGIIALGAAAEGLDPQAYASELEPLRDGLQNAICERLKGVHVNGNRAPRVSNTLNLTFEGINRDGLVQMLDLSGYCVSSGSACSSGLAEPSHVLLAMGRTEEQAKASIRISLSPGISKEVLGSFVDALDAAVTRLRKD